MKKERWKVTAAVICILVCGIWYSRIYGTEQMQYQAAPVTETVEPMPAVININTADQEEFWNIERKTAHFKLLKKYRMSKELERKRLRISLQTSRWNRRTNRYGVSHFGSG